MNGVARLLLLVCVIAPCVACDQVTKGLASAALRDGPAISYLGDTVRLLYAENPGAFLSFGAEFPPLLRSTLFGGVTSVVIALLLTGAVRTRAASPGQLLGIALIVAGSAGNLIDRVQFGSVRDFLTVGVGQVRTGIFNIADLAVTGGIVLLCVASATRTNDETS